MLSIGVRETQTLRWTTSSEKYNFGAFVVPGDFNGDGISDFAVDVVDQDFDTPDIRIFLGSRSGSFTDGTWLLGNRVPTYQHGDPLIVADINQDGLTDIYIPMSNGDPDTQASVQGAAQVAYLSNPDGTFKAITSEQTPYAHGAAIADLNGDGYLDPLSIATVVGPSVLGVYTPTTNSLTFTTNGLPNKAVNVSYVGSWEEVRSSRSSDGSWENAYSGYHQHSAEFLDVDRDGLLDLIMFFASQESLIYLNQGTASNPIFSDSHRISVSSQLTFLESYNDTFVVTSATGGQGFTTTKLKAGFNPYDVVKFDINGDGWTDVLVGGSYENQQIFTDQYGTSTYLNGSDGFNDGTLFETLISNGATLVNETEARVDQIGDWTNTGYHDGFIDNLRLVDLNGDGFLDFMSNNSSAKQVNVADWSGKSHTVFMLNDGSGHFSEVEIQGLRYGSFNPIPVDGKLGFVNIQTAGNSYESDPSGDTIGTVFLTDVPWTTGNAGSNYLYGTNANDSVDGGGGIDTYYANGRLEQFSLSKSGDGVLSIVDSSLIGGMDVLANVERIRFDDVRIAFDLDNHAGQVAKILGAVFGVDSVGNAEYVGIGLDLLDGGMGYSDLAALAVSVAGKSSSADVCNLLWENVIGTPATSNDIAPFKAMLDDGQLSIGQLTTLAADTSFNTENIDLVGLAQTGLEYV